MCELEQSSQIQSHILMLPPFGLYPVPKLFNILVDLLEWIARAEDVLHIMHYLDEILTLGPSMSLHARITWILL